MQAQMQDVSVMSRLRELQFAFVQWLSELVLWLTKAKEMFKFYHLNMYRDSLSILQSVNGKSTNQHRVCDQPRGIVVRLSDYWSWGPGFDSRFYHGYFSLKRKIPMVTVVWVELRLRPLLVLHIHKSPSTSSGQRNCVSWASQPQESVTLQPQPGGETTKPMWWHWQKNCFCTDISLYVRNFRLNRELLFQLDQ
jgi:hypothetical protein